MEEKKIKEIDIKLEKLTYLLQSFIVLQLIEKGLGREDIRFIVKGLDNRDYSRIYGAYKRSSTRKDK
ncbi:MAG: hypothetical protein WC241_00705 [Candidatus Paceibacterota bacterium]|jgi:hypothetical protein